MLSSVDSSVARESNIDMMMEKSSGSKMKSMSSANKAKKSKGMFGGMSFGGGFGGGSVASAPKQKAAPVQQVEKAAKSGGGIFSSLFGSKA
jgi:hypothetical protein